jgi:hypothetical protein
LLRAGWTAGECSAQLYPALEFDDVKKPENVIEKKKRKPENNNSDDEFAEIETTATFRIHESPAILRMVTFSTCREKLSNQNIG